jgi:16S rRNA (guanine966-N2)-methyltransferase
MGPRLRGDDVVRIVGGQFRGRPLTAPAHEGTRPTSDRAREAVFNILAHGIPEFELAGARVLDLFAGTGALGLEALSRGAAFCLFVEQEVEARALVRRNIEALGLTGVTKVFRRDATELGSAGRNGGATLAFLDPPYGQGLAERALASAVEGGWLAPGAITVIEERKGTGVALPAGFNAFDQRTWGETQALFARFAGGQTQGQALVQD